MSAIAGLWRLDGRPDAAASCARMLDALAPFGPDDASVWDGGDVALGRRLKHVLPEDVFDRQPLRAPAGLVLVADARLDNREELAAALGLSAADLRAGSDVDVLLAAYGRWGLDAFDHLAGDYACAIWDSGRRRLILARDPTGRRPLSFHRAAGLLAFATLPAGLHALAQIPRIVDPERTAAYLTAPSAGAAGVFKGVERVPAGSFLVADASGVRETRHWRPQPGLVRFARDDDYVDAAREHLDRAVAACLRGAGDVAAHLSAGLDSSGVAATAARRLAPSGGRVGAFTAAPRVGYAAGGLRGRLLDESQIAAGAAALYPNMDHAIVRGGGSPLASLERNLRLYEQPAPNLCNLVWLDAVHAAARAAGHRVLLTGAMGNLGLSYAGLELLPELASSGRWMRWLAEGRAMRAAGARWRGVIANTFGGWLPAPVWRLAGRLNGSPAQDATTSTLVRPDILRALGQAGAARSNRPRRSAFSARLALLQQASAVTQQGVLAEHGLDVRDPTADRRLLDFCLGLPTDQFMRDGVTRLLARRTLADRLPAQLFSAPRGLQAADWHEGLAADLPRLRDEVERIARCPAAASVLDIARMRALAAAWPAGGWDSWEASETYRTALLGAVSAGHFIRRVSGD
ncbi:MAG TPA: asparagine synthase-related protein [Caulobacteraceae bacterium]|nr:asparagine synthase-related protein [Caulobacteraceae bacterium]